MDLKNYDEVTDMKAYEGNQPYIFISYAHKDSPRVFTILEELIKRGYRIWYDEGIEPGSEWPENIAQHLMKCDTFIAFVTENSMNSANCRREINFALSKNKPFLTIMLEKIEIPAGMELQLSAQQSILKYNYNDDNRFYEKIESCSFLHDCKGESEFNIPEIPVKKPVKNTFSKLPIWIGLAAAIALVLFLFLPKDQKVDTLVDNNVDTTVTTDKKEDIIEDTGVSWVYSISRTDHDLIYTFKRGPVITLPLDWDGKIEVTQDEDHVDFYHKASKDAWQMDGYKGGLLMSLHFSGKQDYLYYPSYQDIGSTEEGFYYLTFPTDLQAYFANERISADYSALWSEIDYVKQNVRMN